jgi:hypothetical protein
MSLVYLDNTTPFASANGGLIQWSSGPDGLGLARSSCVRINDKGLLLYPDHWDIRDLQKTNFKKLPCTVAPGMLCQSQWGAVLSTTRIPQINPTIDVFRDMECTSANNQQILNSSANKYDVSMCNVFSGGADLVFYNNTLYIQNTKTSWWEYMLLIALSLYSIRTFSNIIVHEAYTENHFLYIIICIVFILIICLHTGTDIYITIEDYVSFWFVLSYLILDIIVYLINHIYKNLSWFPSFNLVVTCFVLISMRLYNGIISPYIPVLLWVFASRFFLKIQTLAWTVLTYLSLFMDGFLLSVLLVFGSTSTHIVNIAIVYVSILSSHVIQKRLKT